MFKEEDYEKAKNFGEFVHKHARWDLTTQEVFQLNSYFAWYAQHCKKIEDHIFEFKKQTEIKDFVPPAPEPERKKGR